MRTEEEIVHRIREIQLSGRDLFGAETGNLLTQLEYPEAKEFLRPEVTESEWQPETLQASKEAAVGYVPFAIGKMDKHRGLSAGRSIDHMRGWIWLHGNDAEVKEFELTSYTNYGAPKVKLFCSVMGCEDVWEKNATYGVRRMAEGLECRESGCQQGCGS
jgi:hypothetical protein